MNKANDWTLVTYKKSKKLSFASTISKKTNYKMKQNHEMIIIKHGGRIRTY